MKRDAHLNNAALMTRRHAAVARGVGQAHEIFVDRAVNAEVWDVEGRRYIDFAGGIAVLNTGHTRPEIVEAVKEQLDRFSHTCFQVLAYESYVELAERLNALAPGQFAKKSLFLSTGAEAVENAVKIARSFTGRGGVIAFTGGYHGRTLMTLGLTGKVAPYKTGFGPFPGEVFHALFPNALHGISVADALHSVELIFKNDIEPTRVAAFIVEPVQGEGGFVVAPPEFISGLKALADKHGILLILDEVMSGFGRTGDWFSWQNETINPERIVPDLITFAKGVNSGYVPTGGVIISESIAREFDDQVFPGGLTYSGHPLAMASIVASIDAMDEEGIIENAARIGRESLGPGLVELASRHPMIGEVRGLGVFWALDLVKDAETREPVAPATVGLLKAELLKRGLLPFVADNRIHVVPPCTVSAEQVATALAIYDEAFTAVEAI